MRRMTICMTVIGFVLMLCWGSFQSLSHAEKNLSHAEKVHVGAVMALTGVFSFAGVNMNAGLRDALLMANDEGGINGKKIVYISEDGEYKTDVGLAAFKRIWDRYKPRMFYLQSTAMTKALKPDLKSRYKCMYTSASFTNELLTDYAFCPGPTYSDMMGILLQYIAQNKPGAKVTFVYSDTEYGRDPIDYARGLAKELGLDLVSEEIIKVGAVDVTSQVLKIKSKNPDFVILHGYVTSPVPVIIKQARNFGFKGEFLTTFWQMNKKNLEQLGKFGDQLMGTMPYSYWWEDKPMINKIRVFTNKHYPDVEYRNNVYMREFFTGMIMVEVLRRADKQGQLDRDALKEALESIEDWDVGGLTAPVTMKSHKHPVAKIYKGDPKEGIFVPATDWIRLD